MNTAEPSYPLPSGYTQDGLSPVQLLMMLFVHRRKIMLAAVLMAVLAALLSKFVLPKSYESTASLLIDYDVNNPSTGREFPSQLAAGYMATQEALIGSPQVLLPAIDQLGWANDSKRGAGYRGGSKAGLREWLAREKLGKNLSIKAYKDTRLVHIVFDDSDPVMAARVVNTIAEIFLKSHRERISNAARGRAEDYLHQLDALHTRLQDAQQRLSDFRSETGLLEFNAEGELDARHLSALNSRLADLEVASRNAQARASSARAVGQDPEVLASNLVQTLKAQVLELQNNFTLIARELGPRHPDYLAAQKQLIDARALLAHEEGNYARSLAGQARTAGSSQAAVISDIEAQRKRLLTVREQQDRGAFLLRDLEAAKKIYDRALDIYDKAVTPSQSSFENISLASPGTPAPKPIRPVTTINTLLGLLGGGALATMLCLLWELTHRRVRCAEDLEAELGMPLLAHFLSRP